MPDKARRDQRREGEIGIEIGAADAAFSADRLGPLAAQTEARRAIVDAPDRARRRERAGLEALVGIDEGREEIGDLAGVRELARHDNGASASDMPSGASGSAKSGVRPSASHSEACTWLDEPARS